jgi:O-antigen/teichoic acid export membrane protein
MSGPLQPMDDQVEGIEEMAAREGRAVAEPEPSPPTQSPATSGFTKRVTAIFATRVSTLILSLFTSVLVARLLGPELRGVYVVVATLPGMLSALALLGLPNAANYFAGRGYSVASLVRAALMFTALISVVLVAASWMALPFLEQSLLRAVAHDDYLARVMLLTLPLGMLATFCGTILYGRQKVRVYNIILVGQALGSLTGAVVLVGILKLSVTGAVITSVLVGVISAVAVVVEVARLARRDRSGEKAPLRDLLAYGARVYPASVTGYFNARADTYIIQGLAANTEVAARTTGLYGFAVTMAEIVFYVPESVASMFLPKVAGSTHEEAAAMLGRVARTTILVSLIVGVCLILPAIVGIHLVLPKYVDCLPAFFAILPGVISLSVSKVMTSYLGGRGQPGKISMAASIALAANIGANLLLIPMYGIVGAALSSVVSYTTLALIVVLMASRVSGVSPASLCIPRPSDASSLVSTSLTIARRGLVRVRAR